MEDARNAESGGERSAWPLTPELIGKINKTTQPGVLRHIHISLLKKIAKIAPDIDLHVCIRGSKVRVIRYTLNKDYTSFGEE